MAIIGGKHGRIKERKNHRVIFKILNELAKLAGEVGAILCVSGLGLISIFSKSTAWKLSERMIAWSEKD